jgi:hypothetical protein
MGPLLLKRRVVADVQNSALRIIAIAVKKKDFQVSHAAQYHDVFDKQAPQVQLTARQGDFLRDELGKIRGPLEEARLLKDYPYGRFPVKIGAMFIATLLPDHQKPRDLSDWLKHDAWLLAHEERMNDAVDSCRACLCTGRAMGDEPFIISHLIRIAIQTETISGLERVLAQGVADPAALQQMQALLELEAKESTWIHSLRGERAGTHMFFEDLRTGKIPMKSLSELTLTPPGKFTISGWIADRFPGMILNHYPEHLAHMTSLIETAKLPLHEQRSKVTAWSEATKTTDNPVIRLLAPAISKVYISECRSQGMLRASAAALACERFRLANGRWPEALEDLVKSKLLTEVPSDPFDGKSLRLVKDRNKIVVYSIGSNAKDDGGHIDRAQLDAGDVGFRLWHVEKRRQPPRVHP